MKAGLEWKAGEIDKNRSRIHVDSPSGRATCGSHVPTDSGWTSRRDAPKQPFQTIVRFEHNFAVGSTLIRAPPYEGVRGQEIVGAKETCCLGVAVQETRSSFKAVSRV